MRRAGAIHASVLSAFCVVVGGVIAGCSTEKEEGARVPGRVPAGAFALVGELALESRLLDPSSPEPLREAQGLVLENLLGEESRRRMPHYASAIERGILARRFLEHLEKESQEDRPISDEELQEQRSKLWLKYDRPRSVAVAEFFIPVSNMSPGTEEEALAKQIQEAVAEAHNVDEFAELGGAISTDLKVVAQRAPPVAADGRVVSDSPIYAQYETADVHFAQAAAALEVPGDVSDVVYTELGFHVLFVLEITPAVDVPPGQARPGLLKAALASRAEARLEELKKAQNTKTVRLRTDLAPLLRPLWRLQ